MDFNLIKTFTGTAGRLIVTTVAGGVVTLLFYAAFSVPDESSNVLIKPQLTQAEYDALQTSCRQTETPVPDKNLTVEAAPQTKAATLALCDQIESGEGVTIVNE